MGATSGLNLRRIRHALSGLICLHEKNTRTRKDTLNLEKRFKC